MRTHTNIFKEQIKEMGRQLDSVITYGNTTLHDELYSVTPLFESNLLKSVMKQLDVVSSVEIPLDTVINYKLGIMVNGQYEYLDFGNYVVYNVEKQEDADKYAITCFDKMLYSMKDYEDLGITYPVTIRQYLEAIANKIGLTLKNSNFMNESMSIPSELYFGLEYTYRDVLDEIAQATGSNIVINNNDEIEVRYFTDTNDTIDEEYLKNVNVKFGEKYGPINSVVLSRAAESDNVYIKDDESIALNGLCEIKIVDNQIMNDNNRSDYLQGIFDALNGLEYYINDFSSTGICYYEPCDIYNVEVFGNTYKCVMLNDEINVTTGLEELIHTDMPEQGETDYTKADKTDRKINQTTLIVDKQNQIIEGVITNVTQQDEKISRVTQTVDELNSKIGDIADITTSQETLNGTLSFENINQSEPIRIEIHPTGTHISYLYPRTNLYPSTNLYMTQRTLKFTNTTTDEVFIYELPVDLLYHNMENYDEFILDYDSQTCIVNKKVGINADGTTYLLTTPEELTFAYPEILLTDGDYTITLLGYNNAYLFVRLMSQNIYTTQFATKAELNSSIRQTTESIDLSVNQKLNSYPTKTEMNSAINLTANQINLEVNKKVDEEDFTGANITLAINNDSSSATINADKININGTVSANGNFKINTNGTMECKGASITNGNINIEDAGDGFSHFKVEKNASSNDWSYLWAFSNGLAIERFYNGTRTSTTVNDKDIAIRRIDRDGNIGLYGVNLSLGNNDQDPEIEVFDKVNNKRTTIKPTGITTPTVTQTSLESIKKNIQKQGKSLDIVKNADIYNYNLKDEKDTDKKHVGFVIGDKYNTPNEVIAESGEGIDLYTMCSILWKAIQEQQEHIEQLEQRIEKLEKGE